MARNTAPPAEPDTPELSDEGADAMLNQRLETAKALHDELTALRERVTGNRTVLRALAAEGLGSEKQRAAIDAFYPKRERKPKPDSTNGDTPASAESTDDQSAAVAAGE
jgi:hypothetical protein